MFDLITGRVKHLPSHAGLPILLSTLGQATLVGLVLLVPLLYVTERLPEVETIMAFVAAPPPPPPPPPPPAPVAAKPKPAPERPAVPAQTPKFQAPVEEPARIAQVPDEDEAVQFGVPGGVEGGVPGGVVGGVVGGLPEAPPPPPPPPPAIRAPVRVGGQINPPQLVHRVEPYYPPMAVQAHLQGVVILEAIVERDGTVAEVKVLRSVNPLLDREAVLAVRQWRYSPLVLNGVRERFILTVTLSFNLQAAE